MVMAPRRRISPAGVVVVFSVIAAIAVVAWMLILVRSEDSPILPTEEPTGVPTVSPPPATPTVVGTPVPTSPVIPTVPRGSLPNLLTYAPDRLADGSLPLSDVARYADISGWMTARGVAMPAGPDDPAYEAWADELDNLALPAILATRGDDPIWEQTYGFALTDVDQVLAVGQAPDFVLILTGDFDRDALQAAWVRSGYQAVASQNVTLWSLFPGDSIDLSAPASRPALGSFNNVVLLEDGTLVAASRISRLETMLNVVRGNEASLAENPEMAALLTSGTGAQGIASALVTKGSVLETASPAAGGTPPPFSTPIAPIGPSGTPVAPPAMTEVGLMLVGINAPADPSLAAPMTMILSFEEAGDATSAMLRVERALHGERSPVTGHPYTDRLKPIGLQIVGTGDGPAMLVLRARLVQGADDWLAIVRERDVGFVMWSPPAGEE
jgi:hypothetical protein